MHNRPNIAVLRRYVRGELSPKEMFEVEQAAEADAMLMDVLLGIEAEYAQNENNNAPFALRQDIKQRTKNTTPRTSSSSSSSSSYRWIAAAASLLFVFGFAAYMYLKPTQYEQQLAENTAQDIIEKPENNHHILSDTTSSSTSSDQSITDRRRDEKRILAYSNVENPSNRRSKNSSKSRLAALDTIPIQIIPSNTEELILLGLRDDHQALTASNDSKAYARGNLRAAQSISPRPQTNKALQSVSLNDVKSITTGIIIDSETQRPLAGATIRDQEMNALVKTDSTGRFIVGSKDLKPIINVQSEGFESEDYVAEGAMRIALKRKQNTSSSASLQATTGKDKTGKNLPEMGLIAYRAYLDNLARASNLGSGSVTLLFSINAQGRPINIRVKQNGDKKRDKEAIRLVKNGPRWIKLGQDEQIVEWTIRF